MSTSSAVIGVDESGKGDFFGPLVVAAVLADEEGAHRLVAMGARDSKAIADARVFIIDELIRKAFPYVVVVVNPPEYNRRYAEIRNLNKLLASCHAEVIDELFRRHTAGKAISDKFGKDHLIEDALRLRSCPITLEQMHRGEVHPQVAAASIVARARFVRELKELSEKFAVDLPKGAGSIVDTAGQRFVQVHTAKKLSQVAKVHFKNYDKVLRPDLFR
jgi:ribonuclease HIII